MPGWIDESLQDVDLYKIFATYKAKKLTLEMKTKWTRDLPVLIKENIDISLRRLSKHLGTPYPILDTYGSKKEYPLPSSSVATQHHQNIIDIGSQ